MTTASPAFATGELAARIGARLSGPADVVISGLAAVSDARSGDLTFISDRHYAQQWPQSKAAAAVVLDGVSVAPDARPLLFVRNVDHATIPLLEMFTPIDEAPDVGVHPSAVVHASAKVGRMVRIGAHVSVGPNCVLGDGVILHPGARIYGSVSIGDGSVVHANTVVRDRCIIGRGVILHQNVSIGADGFGYRPAPDGRGLVKIPHIGTVIIEDGVEIGANTCVDRAKFGATVIGAGTKIDNLCMIAHNCRIGRACIIAGNSGLAGSVTMGDGVMLAGGSGIVDHATIGSGAKLGAMSLATKDMPPGVTWVGVPAQDARTVMRQWAALRKLPEVLRQSTHTADPVE